MKDNGCKMKPFWDCVALENQVEVYAILANLYMEDTGELLPRPPGMCGERLPDRINAPDYMEEEEMNLDAEVRKAPSHQERVN